MRPKLAQGSLLGLGDTDSLLKLRHLDLRYGPSLWHFNPQPLHNSSSGLLAHVKSTVPIEIAGGAGKGVWWATILILIPDTIDSEEWFSTRFCFFHSDQVFFSQKNNLAASVWQKFMICRKAAFLSWRGGQRFFFFWGIIFDEYSRKGVELRVTWILGACQVHPL